MTKQSATTFSDKEQIWVDNAESSPHFGNAYVCLASFRSFSQGNAAPTPLVVATSSDGGDTWTNKQVTDATNNPFNQKKGFGRSGCTIRTDSEGTVYVFANQFAVGQPGEGAHVMIRSFDGGHTWKKPINIGAATDTCFDVMFDGAGFRCVMDGLAGARDDLSSSPSVDIANGAPTGAAATDVIYRTWVDGGDATGTDFSPVHVLFSFSTDGGDSWSEPEAVEASGDRGYYSAVALSPDGSEAWLVYNAFTTGFVDNTTDARNLVGVVLHTTVGEDGSPDGWTEVHRGADGDPRASAQNNLAIEFLGDYVYASALGGYGVAVWNDVRDGEPCDAVNEWRTDVQDTLTLSGTPAVQQECDDDVREHRHLRLHELPLGPGASGRRRRGDSPGAVLGPVSAVPERLDAHERVPGVRVVHVLARSAVRDVVAPDAVVGGHAEVPAAAALHDVRTRIAPDGVSAGATLDVVVGASPRDQVGPPPAAHVVRAGATVDPVVAPATHDPIVPAEPDDRVVPVAAADHISTWRAPEDVVAVRARDRAPGRAGGLERPSGDRARNDHRREDADDGGRAPAPVTRRCRRSPPSRGSARRSRRWRAW